MRLACALVALAGVVAVASAEMDAGAGRAEPDTLGQAPELIPKQMVDLGLTAKVGSGKAKAESTLHEVVKVAKLHAGVKQDMVEEEKLYSLMSFNFRKGAAGPYSHVDYYVRHMNRNTMISTINGPMDMQDSTFKVLKALCVPGKGKCAKQNAGSTGCVSLESANFPGFFLSATDKKAVKLLRSDGTSGFNARASFCIQPGLADKEAISLESLGKKGVFVRHSGYSLFACKQGDAGDCTRSSRKADFAVDSTFFLKPGLFKGRCAGPKETTKCTCFPGFLGDDCKQICPGRQRVGMAVKVCSGNGNCSETKKGAVCKCRSGFLGKKCHLKCPRDEDDNLCSGHGQCAVNDKFKPVCNCAPGSMGNLCQFTCPGKTAKHPACNGKGSCFVAPKKGKTPMRAECSCNKGFKGFGCGLKCPTDKNGAVCSAHGTCTLKGQNAVCACAQGWRGLMCEKSCPRSENGEMCGGQGTCSTDKLGNAVCRCKKGYGGKACTIMCPGMKSGSACYGNGSCAFDVKKQKATCTCKNTHMGKACKYACPMDLHSSLPCGGVKRGTCVRDKTVKPDQTKCKCVQPYVGKTCHVQCPMFQNKICAGNGECFIKTAGKAQVGVCTCKDGFVGAGCSQPCPKDKSGNTCSGHGKCGITPGNRAKCTCQDGWVGNACASRVCATAGGLFDKKTKQCTCAQGEVCCSKETQKMAAMYKKMAAKEKMKQATADEFIQFPGTVQPLV